MWILVLADLALGLAYLRPAAMACLAGFLACALPRASVHIRVLLGVAAAASAWSILAGNWPPVRRGLEAGIIMGAFFPTIMLLRATADESPLFGAARERIARFDLLQCEAWVQGVSHVVGSFLMIGGHLIARAALPEELDAERRMRLAEASIVGLSLSACWSPFFVAGAIAAQLVPSVHAWELLVLGLGMGAIGWSLSYFLFYRGLGARGFLAALRSVGAFALPSAVLVALVVAVSIATGLKSLQAIVLVIPGVCLAYLATRGRAAAARALLRVPRTLSRLADELIIFTAAMCLGAVVAETGAGRGLSQLLGGLAEVPLLLIGAEVALIIGLGFVGVHPMVTVTLTIPVLLEARLGLSELVLSYTVVLGWMLSSLAAIWTLPVASAAMTFDVPVRRLAFGRNMRFMLAYAVVGCVALAAVNTLLK